MATDEQALHFKKGTALLAQMHCWMAVSVRPTEGGCFARFVQRPRQPPQRRQRSRHGYVRVSQVGGRGGSRFISPLVQRQQIEGWAQLHGAAVGEIFEELDESGGRADRPLLMRALERVETGASGGIVVAKLDRFGRSLVDGLASIERIEAAGATFVSVQDGLDLATPTGKLVLRLMLSMGEWELDRVRANWDVARQQAVARGCFISAWVPLGYVRDEDSHLHLDPLAAPAVAAVFRRRADGERMADLCRFLDAAGLKSAKGNSHFVQTSLRGIIENRVYLGESRCGDHVNADAHEPLIDAPTWQAAQTPKMVRTVHRESGFTLLGGILRCASCRMGLHAVAGEVGRETPHYRCGGHSGAGPCPAPVRIAAPDIEPQVEDLFFRLARRQRRAGAGGRRRAEESLRRAEDDLTSYRDNPRFLRTLGPESFERGLRSRQGALEKALLDLASLDRRDAGPFAGDPKEPETRWPSLSVRKRRKLVRAAIDCVFVAPGDSPVRERAWVFTAGTSSHDLPRRGLPALEVRPFVPGPGDDARMMLRRPKRWAERRLRRELAELIGEERRWPLYTAFARAGKARLHEQAMMNGGPWWWVSRLGLAVDEPRQTLVWRWDDEKLADALLPFLTGRDSWPSRAEFVSAGLAPLEKQVAARGGLEVWAKRFGIPATHRLPGPRVRWTDESVEAELRRLTRRLSTYPTPEQFRSLASPGFYAQVTLHGGHRHWRRVLGFPPGRRRRSKSSDR